MVGQISPTITYRRKVKMKRSILFAALAVAFATPAFADTTTSNAGAQVSGVTAASQQANGQNVVVEASTIPTDTKATIRNVPGVVAPSLTTTLTETCMGSTSIGGAGAGFGFSAGTTWKDSDCVNRLNSRELKSLGFGEAAREVMCENDVVRSAFKRVGQPCVVDQQSQKQVDATPASTNTRKTNVVFGGRK